MPVELFAKARAALATRSYFSLIRRAHSLGYIVELIYVWLCSVALARERVARRVAEGGHDIPSHVVERRKKCMQTLR